MSLVDITQSSLLTALKEYDSLGEAAFVRKHGASRPSAYPLLHNGRRYDSRAIVGAAHGYATGRFLRHTDFTSGHETIALVLERLGFRVERGPDDEQDASVRELLTTTVGLTAGEALALLWVLSRLRQGQPTEIDQDRLVELLSRYSVAGLADEVLADLHGGWLWRKIDDTATLSDRALEVLDDNRAARAFAGHLSDTYLLDTDLVDLLRSVRLPATSRGRAFRAWSLLTLSGNRDYQGNDGYEDVTGVTYTYDSTVTYHDDLREGDLLFLRDRELALGTARVERVDVEPGQTKLRRLCPRCDRTGFKPRKTKDTKFLCLRCRHEFDEPATKEIGVTVYTAHYAATWCSLDGAVATLDLEAVTTNSAKQQSIRPLDLAGAVELLDKLDVPVPEPRNSGRADRSTVRGGSRHALVRVREGQQDFRRMLLRWYGVRCAVTGRCPEEALQAAHLRGFAEHQRHVREEGLLLRADIHILFDRGMVAVDPEGLVIAVDPRLREYEPYAAFDGRPLDVDEDKLPDRSALAEHYAAASAGWAT